MLRKTHTQTAATVMGIVAIAAAAFFAGRLSSSWQPPAGKELPVLEPAEVDFERNQIDVGYDFISPLLECESFMPPNVTGVLEAESAVVNAVESAKARGDITTASVYVRDLNNGPWFGVNERERFLPGSLLKVPLMITYLQLAQSDASILDKKIFYDGAEYPNAQNFIYGSQLQPGRLYTVRELIERMIITSDNTAMSLLADESVISFDSLVEVYKDLGIPSPADAPLYETNVITYVSFFRILYNTTYLSRALSDYALELLSRSSFSAGLRAGVPDNIIVSHKFGERLNTATGERQLHDCGIVYASNRPYLLCVMTRGRDFERMTSVIAEVSREVYANVRRLE